MLDIEPKHNKARINLGVCFDKEGQADQANFHYQNALKINNRDPKIHHNMGINLKR